MSRRLAALTVLLCLAVPAPALDPIPDKLVVLTFDDASKSHHAVARPLLLKHNFGATFFVTEGWDFATNKKDYLTWAEIAELHKDGFEIGNHTLDHKGVTDKTVRDLPAQVRAINARCKEHDIPPPVSFAYPGNAIVKEVLPVLGDLGIKFARRGGSPEHPYKEGRGFAYEPGLDHPLLVPTSGDARPTWTLDDLKAAVSQARHGKIAEYALTPESLTPAPKAVRSRTAGSPPAEPVTRKKSQNTVKFTPRQGQFLAFIYLYRKLHRRGPAETDLTAFFRVTPPSVHGMVVKLEERGLITREPGVPRSMRVTVPAERLPELEEVAGPPW